MLLNLKLFFSPDITSCVMIGWLSINQMAELSEFFQWRQIRKSLIFVEFLFHRRRKILAMDICGFHVS